MHNTVSTVCRQFFVVSYPYALILDTVPSFDPNGKEGATERHGRGLALSISRQPALLRLSGRDGTEAVLMDIGISWTGTDWLIVRV